MKRNEKILAAVLGCFILGWFGWPMIDSMFLAPTRNARDDLARMEKQVADKEYEKLDLELAQVQLADWEAASLPPNPTTAQRLYMQWLRDLAGMAGITDLVIEPGRRVPSGATFTAVQVTLQGQGTFDELQSFLEAYHRVDLVHRILSLEIKRSNSNDSDPVFPFEFLAEGLCLEGAPDRATLFPTRKLTASLSSEETTLPALDEKIAPKVGDWFRVGDELIAVANIEGDHVTLKRGVLGTQVATHASGDTIEYFRQRRENESTELFASLTNPFIKPRPPAEKNTEPFLAQLEPKTVFHGETVEWTLDADDEETPDNLRFNVENAPDGVSIDSRARKLSWRVPTSVAPGTQTLHVIVTDGGSPAMTASQSVSVTVKENLKPYVHLVGTTAQGDIWDAWLWDRSEGRRISLHAGQAFEAVGLSGLVSEIFRDRVVLKVDGVLWELELGQHLGEMSEIEQPGQTTSENPVEAPRPKPTVVAQSAD